MLIAVCQGVWQNGKKVEERKIERKLVKTLTEPKLKATVYIVLSNCPVFASYRVLYFFTDCVLFIIFKLLVIVSLSFFIWVYKTDTYPSLLNIIFLAI